jgi:membrane protein
MLRWFQNLEDRLFTQSRYMGPPWGPVLRVVRYPAALARDWLVGEISVWAMSLAYTTLLSMVPLLVFILLILKGLGARGDLRIILEHFFQPMASGASQLTESVLQFVSNMRSDLLGTLGLAFLVYTVITMIQKIENSFNYLWRVDRPRSFMRRIAEYLSIMILGPILLAVTLALLASAENSPLAKWLDAIAPLAWTLGAIGRLLPYVLVTMVFTFMYLFIPNTKVQLRAALIGGITAGIIWALVGKVFTAFIVYSSSMVAIYTGFAIVLITLLWIHLSWLILLIGGQLAFYLQFPQYLRYGQGSFELTGRDCEQVALSLMYLIGRCYTAGRAAACTAPKLAAELDTPGIVIAPILGCLEGCGLIVVTERGEFIPARDLDRIGLTEILDCVRSFHSSRSAVAIRRIDPAIAVLKEVESAMREPLGNRSLKDLVAGLQS